MRTPEDTATGAVGGAPYVTTKRCTGLGKRLQAPPLGPSVELLVGPQKDHWVGETHADTATRAFGETCCWTTERCTG
eukprot:2162226-Pyramimonas_sp.AAC.1